MKATGMTRPVDELGRVVLPKEIRKTLGIEEKDRLEIFIEGKDIVLRKYNRGCTFCGSMDDLKKFGGQEICGHCREEIRKAYREGKC